MNACVDLALEKHAVKLFVVLSGSLVTKDACYTGQVWPHLQDIGIDYDLVGSPTLPGNAGNTRIAHPDGIHRPGIVSWH